MKHFASSIAGAVAGVFGRRIAPRQDFPLDLLARDTRVWVSLLLHAAQKNGGKGFRQPSFKRRGFPGELPPGPFKWADLRAAWEAQRRPDKVAAAERNARNPVFTGKLNYRRSDPLHPRGLQ